MPEHGGCGLGSNRGGSPVQAILVGEPATRRSRRRFFCHRTDSAAASGPLLVRGRRRLPGVVCVSAELLSSRATLRLLSEDERDELLVDRWCDNPMRSVGL